MTMTKRTQGRPPRNSGINGREKLIEATRIYLRSNRKLSLTRTEIAQGCGVTPALISYYFKDKRSLLNAVTKPLLRSYRAKLSLISSSQLDPTAKMSQVIHLLIQLNTDDAFLADHMLQRSGREDLDMEDRAAVDAFQSAIADLVQELMQQGHWRLADPRLVEIALWGICRSFGETLRQGSTSDLGAELEQLTHSRVAFVYEAFQAAGAQSPPSSVC